MGKGAVDVGRKQLGGVVRAILCRQVRIRWTACLQGSGEAARVLKASWLWPLFRRGCLRLRTCSQRVGRRSFG
jgi:hypothetical protein